MNIMFYHTSSLNLKDKILQEGILDNGSNVIGGGNPYRLSPTSPHFLEKNKEFIRFDIKLSPLEASEYLGFMSGVEVLETLNKNLLILNQPVILTENDFITLRNHLTGNNVFQILKTIPPEKIINYKILE